MTRVSKSPDYCSFGESIPRQIALVDHHRRRSIRAPFAEYTIEDSDPSSKFVALLLAVFPFRPTFDASTFLAIERFVSQRRTDFPPIGQFAVVRISLDL
jgi:hypothetical protein